MFDGAVNKWKLHVRSACRLVSNFDPLRIKIGCGSESELRST